MLLLKVADIKDFMSKLLVQQVFDQFLLTELEVQTSNLFCIDGRLNKGWFDSAELDLLQDQDYVKWLRWKPVVYQIIKGNKVPESMKIVFMLSKDNREKIAERINGSVNRENVSGFFLNMKYEKEEMFLSTGVAYTVFTMDKTMEQQWDLDLKKYLKYYNIVFQQLS